MHYYWTVDIHANNLAIRALKFLSRDTVQDFVSGFADEIIIKVALPKGVYQNKILPYQANLEITLYKNPILEGSDVSDLTQVRQTERFEASLLDKGSDVVASPGMNPVSQQGMDLTDIEYVEFQLINKAVNQIRMLSVGTVVRGNTPEETIQGFLYDRTRSVRVDGQVAVSRVDMVKASNQTKRNHISLEHGLRLTDLPGYIQEHVGVYSTGLSHYIQDDIWYVWPTYDTTRFDQSVNPTITFINVPRNKMPGIERTYRQTGRNTVALVTGDVRFSDNQDKRQLNLGNGVRFTDANKITDFVKMGQGRALASRGGSNTEAVSVPRENGLNNVTMSDNPITTNSWKEYSKLAIRQGNFLEIVWENSNPNLLYPGIPVKFIYLDGDEIKTLTGVVLGAHHYVETQGVGALTSRHKTNTALSLFVV